MIIPLQLLVIGVVMALLLGQFVLMGMLSPAFILEEGEVGVKNSQQCCVLPQGVCAGWVSKEISVAMAC